MAFGGDEGAVMVAAHALGRTGQSAVLLPLLRFFHDDWVCDRWVASAAVAGVVFRRYDNVCVWCLVLRVWMLLHVLGRFVYLYMVHWRLIHASAFTHECNRVYLFHMNPLTPLRRHHHHLLHVGPLLMAGPCRAHGLLHDDAPGRSVWKEFILNFLTYPLIHINTHKIGQIVTLEEATSGFGKSTVIAIGFLFANSAAVSLTGSMRYLSKYVLGPHYNSTKCRVLSPLTLFLFFSFSLAF